MLVVDFASKWVLVHEFMHHLFHSENNKRQREGIGFSDAEIEKQMQETRVTELSKNFDQDKTEANAVILATEYRKFSLLLLEQMRRFPLEEMTIEILLLERVEKKDFKYIQDDVEIKSAANYVLTSFTNYGNLSNQIKRMNLKLSRDLKKVSVPASKMLEKVIDDFLLVDAEAEQLYNRAAEILDRTIPVPDTTVGIVAAKVDNEPIQEKKCSHSNYSLNINVLDLK